jgi:hypothetical protein
MEPSPHPERQIRTVEGGFDRDFANAVEDIHQDRLDALVLRGGLPDSTRRAIVARLGDEMPWHRPNQTGPRADIRVLGVAATPTFATPGGPPVESYFDEAARYAPIYDQLLGGSPNPLEALIGLAAGGRPVERLTRPDGTRFAGYTIRSLPEGQRIIVHNDHSHMALPIYRDVVAGLDTSTTLSILIVLQAPAGGGELVIHGLAHADPTPRFPNGFPDGEAIARQYPGRRFALAAGDVMLFAAGRLYHHVAPVVGAEPRITLGAFLTLDRDHRKVLYWN